MNNHEKNGIWTSDTKITPPIDCTNDSQMVREDLRQPMRNIDKSVFAKTDKEKAILKTHIAAYTKLKTNKVFFKETLKYILDAFNHAKSPKWDSFKFNGIQI